MAIKNYFWIMLFAIGIFVMPYHSYAFTAPTLIVDLNGNITDTSSNNITCGDMGTASTTFTTGLYGQAASFSGNNFINCGTSMFTGGDFSVQAWVNRTSGSTGEGIVTMDDNAYNSGSWKLYVPNAGNNSWFTYQDNNNTGFPGIVFASSSINISDGNWHLLTATKTGTQAKFYVDGTLRDTQTIVPGATYGGTFGLLIGSIWLNAYKYNGLIEGVVFWDSAISGTDVSTYWNGGSGCAISSTGSCGGGGGSNPSISFVLPNASGTSPDFQNWLLNVSTTVSSTYGNVKVWYGQSSSSYDFSDQAQFSAFVSANPFPLSKSQLLNPLVSFYSTSTWYAMAEYSGDGFDVTSSQIMFHINPIALTPNTSSSALVGYFSPIPFTNPSSTGSSSLPYADCGITQIGGCLTNAGLFLGNFFFQPNPQVVNSMNANFNHIKGSFPFSAFFNVIDTAKANATTTSGNYDLYLTIPATGQKIPILTSTTLEMAIGSSSKAMVFTTEKNIIWLGTGVAMLSLLLL